MLDLAPHLVRRLLIFVSSVVVGWIDSLLSSHDSILVDSSSKGSSALVVVEVEVTDTT